ncbi:hypothetical protein [Rhodanobacter sp. 115]|nr:hypothetical protein [Rhodanobacter sp. 115]
MMTNMGGTTMFGMGIGWILIVVVSVIIIACATDVCAKKIASG